MSKQVKKRERKDSKTMTPKSPTTGEEVCPVCHDPFKYYALGQCDHPVCFRCSTRMRVLCELQYCPICRADIPKVVFVKSLMDFAYILTHRYPYNRKFKIYFEDEYIQQEFHELLENWCEQCEETFRTFKDLERHKRRHHDLYACDICTQHLKIFPHERKFYNRKDLATHRRVGDTNDKSHRGHPLCEFCEERYLDNDELVCHLRKDHYFCHFCDADGISNQFYSDYNLLRNHFRDGHFLCEEGDCQFVEFTNAFHDEIDYKAHMSQQHSKGMRKGQAKQARTIDIEVNLKPRPHMGRGKRREESVITGDDYLEAQKDSDRRGGGYSRGRGRGRGGGRGQGRSSQANREEEELAMALKASLDLQEKKGGHIHVVDPALVQGTAARGRMRQDSYHAENTDFPTLNGQVQDNEDADSDSGSRRKSTLAKKLAFGVNMSVQNGGMAEDDFPALGGAGRQEARPAAPSGPVMGGASKPLGRPASASGPGHKQPSSGASRNQPKLWSVAKDDFPTLGQSAKPKRPAQDDFPSLPSKSVHPSDGWKPAQKSAQKPVFKLQHASAKPSKAAPVTKQSSRPYRERSPEAVPITLDNPRLSDTMSQQVSLIQGTDIVPEPPPKSVVQQLQPPSKSQTTWFDDFPALGGRGRGKSVPKGNIAQWGASAAPKPSPKVSKKKPKPPGLDDFPALNSKTVIPVQTYVPQSWTEIADSPSPPTASGDGEFNPALSLLSEEPGIKADGSEVSRDKPPAKNFSADDFPSLGGKKNKVEHDFSSHWSATEKKGAKLQEESADSSGDLDSQTKAKKKNKGKKKDDSSVTNTATVDSEVSSETLGDGAGKSSKKKKVKGKEQAGTDSSGYISSEAKDTKPVEKKKRKNGKKDENQTEKSGSVETERLDESSSNAQPAASSAQGVPAEETGHSSDDSFSDSDFKDALDDFPTLNSVTKPAARPVVEVKPLKAVVTPRVVTQEPPVPKDVPTLSSIGASLEPVTKVVPVLEDVTQGKTVADFSSDDFPSLVNALPLEVPKTVIPLEPVLKTTGRSTIVELSLDDFPALGGGKKKSSVGPPGFHKAAAPPGFSTSTSFGAATGTRSKPPPGFKPPATGKSKPASVLSLKDITVKTDTDIAAELNIDAEPTSIREPAGRTNTRVYEYQQPAGFQDRNHQLIADVQASCGGDASTFDQFKALSGQYRTNQLSAADYYAMCSDLLGSQNFTRILPELVTLLPDINKQQELFQAQTAANKPKGRKPKKGAWSTPTSENASLRACPECRQVLSQRDFSAHSHETAEADFPALGGSAGSSHSVLRAWVKAT